MGRDKAATQDVPAHERIARLLVRADEAFKAAASAVDGDAARARVQRILDEARDTLPDVGDADQRLDLAAAVARRVGDLDEAELVGHLGASEGVRPAPTKGIDPARIPPGQRLTAGFPILHVGTAPTWTRDEVRIAVAGRVLRRQVFTFDELASLPQTSVTTDFHCVTRWSRLDTSWRGVRVRDLIEAVGAADDATHAVVFGHPAYSANLPLEQLMADNVLLAWEFDGQPLARERGGPVRLLVPALYGWKSVKWVTEIRLTDRDVPGYWEERGYHELGDPWHEQRFRGDGD